MRKAGNFRSFLLKGGAFGTSFGTGVCAVFSRSWLVYTRCIVLVAVRCLQSFLFESWLRPAPEQQSLTLILWWGFFGAGEKTYWLLGANNTCTTMLENDAARRLECNMKAKKHTTTDWTLGKWTLERNARLCHLSFAPPISTFSSHARGKISRLSKH